MEDNVREEQPITWIHIVCNIADFTGLPYFSGILSGLKSHGLVSHDYLSQST